MELSWEKVSARLQPATAGHTRLVLCKTVPFFCTSLYVLEQAVKREEAHEAFAQSNDMLKTVE